jgi:hypothetical protein
VPLAALLAWVLQEHRARMLELASAATTSPASSRSRSLGGCSWTASQSTTTPLPGAWWIRPAPGAACCSPRPQGTSMAAVLPSRPAARPTGDWLSGSPAERTCTLDPGAPHLRRPSHGLTPRHAEPAPPDRGGLRRSHPRRGPHLRQRRSPRFGARRSPHPPRRARKPLPLPRLIPPRRRRPRSPAFLPRPPHLGRVLRSTRLRPPRPGRCTASW